MLWRKREELFSNGQVELESASLLLLGLSPESYYPLKNEANKKEYIRKVIAQSSPSFGRFMTEVYAHREGAKDNKDSEKSARSLTQIRDIVKKDVWSKKDVLDLCVCAYNYSRAAKL